MGKVLSDDKESNNGRQKNRLKNSNKRYLKPGDLAQLRYCKATGSKPCIDIKFKRIGVLKSKRTGGGDVTIRRNKDMNKSPIVVSPVRFEFAALSKTKQRTPRTPRAEERLSESRLESLPFDLLVKIICHLHHDDLPAVFRVSEKIRKAVILSRDYYFNYKTPLRTSKEKLQIMSGSTRCEKGLSCSTIRTPMAPKQGPRHRPSRMNFEEIRQITTVLFQEPPFSSKFPKVLAKPICKSVASNRVLLYEDELCQAVAQNKLL